MSNCNKLVIIYTTLVVTINAVLMVSTMFFIVSVLIYALRSVLRSALGTATDAADATVVRTSVDAVSDFVVDTTKTRCLADADAAAAAEALAVVQALAAANVITVI